MSEDKSTFWDRVKHSIFRSPVHPGTDRERTWAVFTNLILHVHPRVVPEKTLKFSLTWGLGGMAVVLVVLQVLTGILLLFVYKPFPDRAYDSILTLQNDVFFGQLVRNIHHWSGNVLVIVAFLHMLRVFFTGAFHKTRQFNWLIGLSTFFCVLLSNFTGYLLPWDQVSFWAITISTSMIEHIPGIGLWLQKVIRGGSEVGPSTLLNFFTFHTTIIPVCLFVLLPIHFWRIRKAGGLVIPRSPGDETDEKPAMVQTIPDLVLREFVAALVLLAFIMLCSVFFNAPLGAEANPGLSPNPTKAPWFFSGIQELLLHLHPFFSIFVIPVGLFIGLILLPYKKYDAVAPGVWFYSRKGRRLVILSSVTALVLTPIAIITDEFFIDLPAWMPELSHFVSNGGIPFGLMLLVFFGFYSMVRKRYSASNNEMIQALFVLLLTSFVVMTVICVWFRGEAMALVWPWSP